MRKLFFVWSLLYTTICFSQNLPAELKVKARVQKDKILIRWAVTNPVEWQKANKSGFFITKFLVKKGKTVLQKPEKIELIKSPILPAKLENWKDIIVRDNYAAIIAQALYGESFKVTETKESAISKIVNTAEEIEQRHSFGLFAAEQSFEGAKLAGWAFEDNNVKADELYVYQISVNNNKKIKPASVAVSLSEYEDLPKIKDFTALGDDKKILLVWDHKTYENTYTSFKIERSEDEKNFISLTKTPIIQLATTEKQQKRMYFADTVFSNEKSYHYRIYGITSFGENGPKSDVISTRGVPDVFYTPRIVDYKIDKQNIQLEWEFPKDFENQIDGFEVHHASNDKGPYKIVSNELAKEQRKFSHSSDLPSNYYKIGVIGKSRKVLLSHSTLVQPIDSIPPSIPVVLEKMIDSTGIVKIKFKKNEERDFLGYRIYKANSKEEEFVDVFNKPFTKSEFVEKLSLKFMTDKVYYKFASEDKRNNLSQFSEIIEFKKPDKIPPTAPVFDNYSIENGKVKILWVSSYSDDVVFHVLERKKKSDNNWKEVFRTQNDLEEFIDESLVHNTEYQYRIKAIDDVGLVSDLSNAVITVKYRDNSAQKAINNLIGEVNRETKKIRLSWQYAVNAKKVDNLQIFKNKVGEKPSLWKESSKLIYTIDDMNIYPNNEYEYHFLITTKDNQTLSTESIKVTY